MVRARILKSAHNGKAVDYVIENYQAIGPDQFLTKCYREVIHIMKKHTPSKINLKLECVFAHMNSENQQETEETKFISTPAVAVMTETNLDQNWIHFVDSFRVNTEKLAMEKSGWRTKRVLRLHIVVSEYKPLTGSSYKELPEFFKLKKALINIKNNDNQCFKWAITRALHMKPTNNERVDKELRKQAENLNWDTIKFPATVQEFGKFERKNPEIALTVFAAEKPHKKNQNPQVYTLWKSPKSNAPKSAILFHFDSHFSVVKNKSRLLSGQIGSAKHAVHICERCMHPCSSETALENHERYCRNHDYTKTTYPEAGENICKFRNFQNTVPGFIVMYADFECMTEKICEHRGKKTTHYQKHSPTGFSLQIVRRDGKNRHIQHTGPDAHIKFAQTVEEITRDFYFEFRERSPKIITADVNSQFKSATHCHLCYDELENDRVKDHCWFSGKFRGVAHKSCEKAVNSPKPIPVIFHNLSGYDERLFLRDLANSEGNVSCIAKNEENFISFNKSVVVDSYINELGFKINITRDLRFIDSMKFMLTSLAELVGNLSKSKFHITREGFPEREKFDLVTRKGVYPYDYVDSFKKLSETELPPKIEFQSKLTGEHVTKEDYQHAQKVWNVFNCETLRDYHDLYLETNVRLLADVFEEFRKLSLEEYGLDPIHYCTSPGLAWDAMLKKTGVELQLFTKDQAEMYLMVENGCRGGVSTITHRHAKANNKYMKAYDPKTKSSFIFYVDANNLYGWAMSFSLPTGNFRWMTDKDLESWEKISNTEGTGCTLEVDLEYPEELHDAHKFLPLAPERVTVEGSERLVPNLWNKKHYVIHHEALKCYVKHGLKITKIHKGIKYDESPWLQKYIDLNNDLRTNAKNGFEKDFYKLMNNSVFGKTLEDVRKRVNIQITTNEWNFVKQTSKVTFTRRKILTENMSLVHLRKTQVKLNKPIYVGQAILDISKTLMYDFHYEYVTEKWGDRAKLLFTDTDSLCYHIETDDVYKDISDDVKERFDTSNYPKDHPSGIPTNINKKVLGMFKDEAGGEQIDEFVGLRAKCYAYKLDNGEEIIKCKGVSKTAVKQNLTVEKYRQCLESEQAVMVTMNVIRSHDHTMFSESISKKAISANDTKRIILGDGITTLPYGHYSTE